MANMHLVTGYAGEPHVTAADFGAFWAALIGSGDYVFDYGQKFAATIVSNNLIRIADGELLMQGRHGRINPGTTVELTVENGTSGMMRNDLIVARYTKSEETGVEDINPVVILGTPAESSPADPEYITGNILNGDLQRDFPLFRVNFNGTTLSSIEPLFVTIPGMLANAATLDSRVSEAEKKVSAVESVAGKLVCGSYDGTGTASKKTITCGFKPKYVLVLADGSTRLEWLTGKGLIDYLKTVTANITYVPNIPTTGSFNKSVSINNSLTITTDNASISWKTNMITEEEIEYNDREYTATIPTAVRAEGNYNKSGITYYYMILG